MKVRENRCCDCADGLSCLGSACPNKNVPVYYCDRCGDELTERYVVDDEDLCEDCLKELCRAEDY